MTDRQNDISLANTDRRSSSLAHLPKPVPNPRLAVLLERHREEIVACSVERICGLPGSSYRQVARQVLSDSLQQGMGALIEWFVLGSTSATEMYLASLSQQRLVMGFDIGEIVEALILWKDVVLQVVRDALQPGADATQSLERIDDYLRFLIGHFSHVYADAMQKHLREQQVRTALMYHIVQVASGSFDLAEILQRVAHGIVNALHMSYCALYLMDAERGVLVPRVVMGSSPQTRSSASSAVFWKRRQTHS